AALAAEFGIELALGNTSAGGDFERAGSGISLFHQDVNGRDQHGAATRRQLVERVGMGGTGDGFASGGRHVWLLTWYLWVPYDCSIGTYQYHIITEDTMGVVSSMTSLARQQHTITEAGYHRCWYPVCLASDLAPAKVIGRDFLGTRVVAWRDAAGKPKVQTAWCPHLGADLSVGQVVDGRLRCAYHHWSFDGRGTVARIPSGRKI